ncbi:MAG: 3-oxoacyl-[acyl-carrier-protein] reductase [Bdellovibrionales bacterium]|nr:3-oxoacyl-[acyl-carrier-protein] reductase [Bdellovibrionales bacterium]
MNSSSLRLQNKNILITGASRGIGAGVAQKLAELGGRIALTYSSNRERAEEVCKSLPGSGHFILAMDVTQSESVQQGFEKLNDVFDRLDGLVNNAGITSDQLILRMKEEEFDSVMNTNLRGTFLCSKLAVKKMLKSRTGSIVNISSVIGQMGNPGQTNYAASKSGVEGFTRALALEVASRSIRVNAVAPGYIVTSMTDSLDAKQQEAIVNRIPLARLGTVEDVAYLVAYLLSDESTYVTGQVLHVNGGLYM